MRGPSVSASAFRSLVILFVVALGAVSAHAQEPLASDGQAPAHISLVDGVAILERDGEIDDSPANMPLLAGDRIRTRSGRVEILFADGSTLHLDHNSAVDLQSDELVRLIEGRIRLSIPGPPRQVSYRIDGPQGWAQISEPGEYRIALLMSGGRGSELELAVLRGSAELANEGGQTPLRAGERAFVRAGAAPSYAYIANSSAMDAFDRWSEARRDERLSATAEYLPDEVRPYAATLASYGYWRDEPAYGRVWYPRVAVDWRPYYRGRWVRLRPYGWTWVGHDPWGWPTHHYGRWGFSASGSWFWIPGRTWGAAWVSWAYAPGYVSWCPLGWNNRPIFQININVGNRYDPWRAWTVIPQRHFGYGYVHRNVVRVTSLDHRTRGAFEYRDRAPEIRRYAVPRSAAPIRAAGTIPSTRRSAPVYTNLPSGQERMRTDGARIRVPNAEPSVAQPSTRGARERMVPDRPAVRSNRSEPAVRPQDRAPMDSIDRRAPAARPNPERAIERTPSSNSRVEVPPSYRRPGDVQQDGPRYRNEVPGARPSNQARPPANQEPPSYRAAPSDRRQPSYQPPPSDQRRPSGQRPSYQPPADQRPSYQPRAVPRGEPSRPSGDARPVERRGPDRAPSGSYDRKAPASAQPSAPPSGGQAAPPPKGARPRPGGGGVRR